MEIGENLKFEKSDFSLKISFLKNVMGDSLKTKNNLN